MMSSKVRKYYAKLKKKTLIDIKAMKTNKWASFLKINKLECCR